MQRYVCLFIHLLGVELNSEQRFNHSRDKIINDREKEQNMQTYKVIVRYQAYWSNICFLLIKFELNCFH